MLPSLMKALCPPGVYLCMVMTMTSLSVIMAVVVTNLYHRGRKMRAAPRWLANLCIHWLARPLCVSNDIPLHAAAVDLVRLRALLLYFLFMLFLIFSTFCYPTLTSFFPFILSLKYLFSSIIFIYTSFLPFIADFSFFNFVHSWLYFALLIYSSFLGLGYYFDASGDSEHSTADWQSSDIGLLTGHPRHKT